MKAYKLIQDLPVYGGKIQVNRILYLINNQIVVIATPTEPQTFISNFAFSKALHIEIDLLQEKWIHPHLFKPIKNKVQELLG